MTWKIGVKSHASRLTGSAPGWPGERDGAGVTVGVGATVGAADAPGDRRGRAPRGAARRSACRPRR